MNVPEKAIRAGYDAAGSRELTLDDMEAALEAAAGAMYAQALRDAADWIEIKEPHGDHHHQYLRANRGDVYLLRRRAHDLDPL